MNLDLVTVCSWQMPVNRAFCFTSWNKETAIYIFKSHNNSFLLNTLPLSKLATAPFPFSQDTDYCVPGNVYLLWALKIHAVQDSVFSLFDCSLESRISHHYHNFRARFRVNKDFVYLTMVTIIQNCEAHSGSILVLQCAFIAVSTWPYVLWALCWCILCEYLV